MGTRAGASWARQWGRAFEDESSLQPCSSNVRARAGTCSAPSLGQPESGGLGGIGAPGSAPGGMYLEEATGCALS